MFNIYDNKVFELQLDLLEFLVQYTLVHFGSFWILLGETTPSQAQDISSNNADRCLISSTGVSIF